MDGDTPEVGERGQEGAGHPARRLLLLGGAAAALAVLVDHGLRIDTPPPPPPVPTRHRAPDEALLLAALGELARLDRAHAAVLAAGDNADVRRLRALGAQQSRVLRGRLTNAGVPTAVIDAAVASATAPSVRTTADARTTTAESQPAAPGAGTGTPSPTSATGAAGSTAAIRTPAELGRLLLGSLRPDTWSALTTATTDTRELLAAAYAERLAGALLLGTEAPPPPAGPIRPQLAALTAPLVYAFEVVAAQSTGDQRRAAEATLARLTQLADDVDVTSGSPAAGWALPFPVTTPQAARRLATVTLSSAIDDAAAVTRSDATDASLQDTAHWSARLQAQAVGWGLPLTAFPGASS